MFPFDDDDDDERCTFPFINRVPEHRLNKFIFSDFIKGNWLDEIYEYKKN